MDTHWRTRFYHLEWSSGIVRYLLIHHVLSQQRDYNVEMSFYWLVTNAWASASLLSQASAITDLKITSASDVRTKYAVVLSADAMQYIRIYDDTRTAELSVRFWIKSSELWFLSTTSCVDKTGRTNTTDQSGKQKAAAQRSFRM